MSPPDMLTLIDSGAEGLAGARAALEAGANARPLSEVQLLAPIPRPRQNIICLGMNYVAHAHRSEIAKGRPPSLPPHPVYFTKAVTTVANPEDEVPLDPNLTSAFDYEVELAYIVGRSAKNIKREDAMSYILAIRPSTTSRRATFRIGTSSSTKARASIAAARWGHASSRPTRSPTHRCWACAMRVNGETRQESTVADLIFDIPTTLAVLSQGQTVESGTIISTGTPSGVGMGHTPPKYLKAGDVTEAEVDQIGVAAQPDRRCGIGFCCCRIEG